ncbi:MAG: CHAP domain-containing protein [Alphaproteobacteria bacterium]|nr:CHAP domain-containing protein [Alphaproteobacteria bacterium]
MRTAFVSAIGLLSACAPAPSDTAVDATSELVDIDPFGAAALVSASFGAANPGSELIARRPVFEVDGAPLGELLTFSLADVDLSDEAPCDALFCGADRFSVLASDSEELPLWAWSSAGALVGIDEGEALAFDFEGQRWLTLGERGAVDAWTGERVRGLVPYLASEAELEANLMERELAVEGLRYGIPTCGGNYGTAMASLWGVTAYSNGSCSGSGSGTYQCVELIDRFHRQTTSHYGNANTYDDGDNPRRMNMIFFANNNGTYGPKVGDVLISNGGSYGHVGLVYSVATSSLTVMDQNFSSTSALRSISRSNTNVSGFSTSYSISGWIRPGWEFGGNLDSTSSIYGWTVRNASIVAEDSTGFTINPSSDPGLVSPSGLQIDGASGRYRYVKIRMKSSAPDGNVRVYFTTANSTSWNETKAVSATVSTNNSWTTVAVDMASNSYWKASRVNQLRVDPASNGNSGSSDTITIDKIWLEP